MHRVRLSRSRGSIRQSFHLRPNRAKCLKEHVLNREHRLFSILHSLSTSRKFRKNTLPQYLLWAGDRAAPQSRVNFMSVALGPYMRCRCQPVGDAGLYFWAGGQPEPVCGRRLQEARCNYCAKYFLDRASPLNSRWGV